MQIGFETNSGWQPTKPYGVGDPSAFVRKGSNPQGWHDLEGLKGLQLRPNGGLPFTGPSSADGFRADILPWVARSHELLIFEVALVGDRLPRAIYVYPLRGWYLLI